MAGNTGKHAVAGKAASSGQQIVTGMFPEQKHPECRQNKQQQIFTRPER
jgi:hypothetical protein